MLGTASRRQQTNAPSRADALAEIVHASDAEPEEILAAVRAAA